MQFRTFAIKLRTKSFRRFQTGVESLELSKKIRSPEIENL